MVSEFPEFFSDKRSISPHGIEGLANLTADQKGCIPGFGFIGQGGGETGCPECKFNIRWVFGQISEVGRLLPGALQEYFGVDRRGHPAPLKAWFELEVKKKYNFLVDNGLIREYNT